MAQHPQGKESTVRASRANRDTEGVKEIIFTKLAHFLYGFTFDHLCEYRSRALANGASSPLEIERADPTILDLKSHFNTIATDRIDSFCADVRMRQDFMITRMGTVI